jgi:glucokinase
MTGPAVPSDRAVLAVDVGGTKMAAAIVDRSGRVERRSECPTAPGASAERLLADLTDLVVAVLDGDRPPAVGVGCGGPMDLPAGRVSPLNIPGWRDFPLRDEIARLAGVPVVLHNDAVAMALGEQRYGAGRGRAAFLGIVVSTGVGGGLVLDGKVRSGRTGNAGHIGHVVVDPSGPPCACGGHGCLEAIARGPAIVAWAQAQGWSPAAGAVADGRALVDDARAGDPIALAALTRGGQALGAAVASVAAVVDLDGVAVGGGIANAGDLLLGPAREAYERHGRLDFIRDLTIEAAALGRDAGLVGAAALAFDALDAHDDPSP